MSINMKCKDQVSVEIIMWTIKKYQKTEIQAIISVPFLLFKCSYRRYEGALGYKAWHFMHTFTKSNS